jgi:hypothetical protein
VISPEDLLEQIERDERWLERIGVQVEPPGNLQAVKRRVRLAIDECWLTGQVTELPSAATLAGAKERIRHELATLRAQHQVDVPVATAPVSIGRAYRWASTLTAAAVLLLAAWLGFWSAVSSPDRPMASRVLHEVAAVLGRQLDDELLEWDAIDAELAELEAMLARGPEPGWDEALLDEMGDELDELMVDFGLLPEVS